jgi:hypothetical protein
VVPPPTGPLYLPPVMTAAEKPRANRGRPLSEEHKAKLRAAAVRHWAATPRATGSSTLPAVLLRLELIDARNAGLSFESVWDAAVESATAGAGQARRGWVEVLQSTRPAWAAAYRRDEGQACWSALESARI